MYYLENLKTYPLIYKNSKHAYIEYPFTFDTETSHTPLNRPENNEDEEENPFLYAAVDLSPVLDGITLYIPEYVSQDIDILFVKRVCRRHKIKLDRHGITISELYETYSYMWGGRCINEIDQLREIIDHLATKKDRSIAAIDEPITKGVNGWVYQWAFCFRAGKHFSDVQAGRTSRECATLIKEINDYLVDYSDKLSDKALYDYYKEAKPHSRYNYENPSKSAVNDSRRTVSCIIYAHNLAYDYCYIWPFLHLFFPDMDEFFIKPHTPLVVRLSPYVELRDSYLYFNDSLERITNALQVDHKKRVGLVDYEKIFYPDEKLTADSWEYQYFDVLGLWEALVKDFDRDGYNITNVPLTSTGKIRRECKALYMADYEKNRKYFTNCYTPGIVHFFLMNCFMGGYTHGNREYKNKLIREKVGHRDMRSFYPTELRKTQNLFQCGQFEEIEKPTLANLLTPTPQTVSMGLFTFRNARLKRPDDGFPFLPTSRALEGRHGKMKYSSDNGRAVYIDGCFSLYLTDVDFLILYDQYVFDEINIDVLYTAPADVLPEWLTGFIDSKFYNKTALKDIEIAVKNDPNSTADDKIEANTNTTKEKNKFNGIYGMFVTNPAKPDIVREGDTGEFKAEAIDLDAAMSKHYGYYKGRFNKSGKGFLVYSHGVWCTAYSRRDLYYMLKIADTAKRPDGNGSGIYADTDSLFYIQSDPLEQLFDDINKEMYNRAINGGYYITVNDKIVNYDAFESEKTADSFKFLHSKCYAMEIDGKLEVTVAGVPARRMVDIKDNKPVYIHREEELGSIDRFNDGFTFEKCGGTGAAYIHRDIQTINYNGHNIEVADACIIVPTTKQIKNMELQTRIAQEKLFKYGRGEI